MSWRTHAVLGANTVWLTILFGVDQWAIFFVIIGAFVALLPDLDATNAKIFYILGRIFSFFRGAFVHRGFLHSILFIVILFTLSFVTLRQFHPLLPLIIAVAYATHPFIDGFNYPGVQYLFPYKKKIRLVPKFLASRVDGQFDRLLFLVGTLSLAIFLFIQYYPLLIIGI